jgi:hypothetical protein
LVWTFASCEATKSEWAFIEVRAAVCGFICASGHFPGACEDDNDDNNNNNNNNNNTVMRNNKKGKNKQQE